MRSRKMSLTGSMISAETKKIAEVETTTGQPIPEIFNIKKYPNGLIPKEKIIKIFDRLKNKSYGRYSKTEFCDIEVPFGIIKDTTGYYAIYNEENPNQTRKQVLLGRGGTADVKLLCYLGDGDKVCEGNIFAALKTRQRSASPWEDEHKYTQQAGSATGQLLKRKSKKTEKEKVEFVVEYCPGMNLYQFQEYFNVSVLDEQVLPEIVLKILSLYEEKMLKHGLIHRDIKTENFMFDPKTGKVSLIDYGFARECKKGEYCIAELSGTAEYMDQDLWSVKKTLQKVAVYAHQTEIYALGVLFREILFNEVRQNDENDRYFCKYDRHVSFRNDKELKEFLNKMISVEVDKRPSMDEVFSFFQTKFGKKKRVESAVNLSVATQNNQYALLEEKEKNTATSKRSSSEVVGKNQRLFTPKFQSCSNKNTEELSSLFRMVKGWYF